MLFCCINVFFHDNHCTAMPDDKTVQNRVKSVYTIKLSSWDISAVFKAC